MGLEFVCGLATLRFIYLGPFLMVQWLGLGAFCAVGRDLIPGLGTKIPLQVAFCFTFHCYFVTFIHLSVCLSTFISVPHSFLWICGQKKKKASNRITLPYFYHQHLVQGYHPSPRSMNMASKWASNCLSEQFKTQVEPSLKCFILMLLFFISPLLWLIAPWLLVIACFFPPLFSCLSSPLTCQFRDGIRPTLCTSAAPQLVHLNTRDWVNTPCQIWIPSLLSPSGVHPAPSGHFTWWGSH